MEERKKKLPIGIENFEELQTEDFYYIDKTGLIKELLYNWGKVNLFTRPRRFGKSLNMSMLKTFFEFGVNQKIFESLEISREAVLCREYMGQYPVISVSLKGINGGTYEKAYDMAVQVINGEARRFQYLLDSKHLTSYDKEMLVQLLQMERSESVVCSSLKVLSIAEVQFDEYFGFTDREVKEMLEYYDLSNHYDEVKEWYDGYQFGNAKVYCPWDVINYCDALRVDCEAQPQNYWANTSSNEAVKRFIQESDKGMTRREIEKLVAGEAITREIRQELTYKEMYESIDNIWSVLFTTGYITQRERLKGNCFKLAIPNMEIRKIFTTQIMDYFKENVPKNSEE